MYHNVEIFQINELRNSSKIFYSNSFNTALTESYLIHMFVYANPACTDKI